MNVQILPTGKVFVEYGANVDYQSPLWIVSSSDSEVVYADRYQGTPIARVYKKDTEWYLSTAYLSHWQPLATMSKYEGFLLLLNIVRNYSGNT
jgi:hypothetical protein